MNHSSNGLDHFVDQASYDVYKTRKTAIVDCSLEAKGNNKTSDAEDMTDEEPHDDDQLQKILEDSTEPEDEEKMETADCETSSSKRSNNADNFQAPPESVFMQPHLQSVPAPAPTMIPYTSRSTEAKMFAAQQAWLMTAPTDLVGALASLDNTALGTIMSLPSSQISLQASKLHSAKAKDDPASRPLKCSECKEWFFSTDKLTVHLISNHGRHHCSYCPQMFEVDTLREEHEREAHFPLECDICLTSVINLDRHYEEEHEMRNCRYCGVLVKPKSYYQVHVRRKHFVTCVEALEERDVRLVGDWSERTCAWNFHCHLCGKERKRADIFGHFFSYHRLSLMCLVVFLRTEQMLFSVQGTLAPPGVSSVDPPDTPDLDESSSNTAEDPPPSSVGGHPRCTACTKPFTSQVPKPAHDVFCHGLLVCRYCSVTFSDPRARSVHLASEHRSFPCQRGCDSSVAFPQEVSLQAHYEEFHSEVTCHFCEEFLPNDLQHLAEHLKTKHSASGRSKALLDSGIGLLQANPRTGFVTCVLCCANVTSSVSDLALLCKHLQLHAVSLFATLAVLEGQQRTTDHKILKKRAKTGKPKKKNVKNIADLHLESEVSVLPKKRPTNVIKKIASKKALNLCITDNVPESVETDDEMGDSLAEENGCKSRGTVIMDGTKGLQHILDKTNPIADASTDLPADSSSDLTSEDDSEADDGSEISSEENDDGNGATAATRMDVSDDLGEAEIDPTEIECVMDDTSDDEDYNQEENESELQVKPERVETDENLSCGAEMEEADYSNDEDVGNFAAYGKQSFRETVVKCSGDAVSEKAMDILERTMEDMFQEPPRSETKKDKQGLARATEESHKTAFKSKAAQKCYEGSVQSIKPDPDNAATLLDAIFKCEICPKGKSTLRSPVEYVKHMKTFHKFAISPHCSGQGPEASVGKEAADGFAFGMEVQRGGRAGVYQCPFCAIRSVWRSAIRQHALGSHPAACATEPPAAALGYRCRYCDSRFWRPAERNEHQISKHEEHMYEFYKCYVCSHISSSKLLLTRHLRVSHPAEPQFAAISYKCKLCLLTYPTLLLLRDHFTATHPAAMVFPCTHCNMTLKNKKTLKSHMKNVHASETGRPRECAMCGKVLYSKRAHAIHYRMKHSQVSKVGFRCRICQRRFDTKDDRKMHYAVDHLGESPYHCGECGKGFASKSGMYGHKQLHTGSGVSKCQYCGKEFTRKDSYNEHLLIHNGPRHKCPHCVKEFVQRSNLVRHIRIHTGEKPYKCLYCDKCFSDKGACNSHIRVHTREETCSCPYCGQTFSKKQKLKYHIRKHTGEGLINCEVCSKSFTNSFALKEHRLIHNRQTSILCGVCGKGFNSEKYLQRHVAIVHEPQHTFTCPLCSKSFSQQTRLKSHLMTHTGVKHMKCLLCDKAYSVRKSLRRHLLEKHQVAPDHPQYKRCFYAMTHQEAGLQIPADMSFFVSFEEEEDEEDSSSPAEGKKRSPRKTKKKQVEGGTGGGKKARRKQATKKVELAAEKPSTSKQQGKKRQKSLPKKVIVDKPGGSVDDSSCASSESSAEVTKKGIGNIVDRLQKRLGPGGGGRRKKRSVEEIVETLQKVSSPSIRDEDSTEDEDESSDDGGPVLARLAALNSGPRKGVGRRSLVRKPVPERIPRKATRVATGDDVS